jgi:hypothetical protein
MKSRGSADVTPQTVTRMHLRQEATLTTRVQPLCIGRLCFPGYENRSSPYRPCYSLSPPAACHPHATGNLGIVSSCTHWQAVPRLSWLSFSPPGFVVLSRGPFAGTPELVIAPGTPVTRRPLPTPANVRRGTCPRRPRPDFHRFKRNGSRYDSEVFQCRPSSSAAREGHRIELADYSPEVQNQKDYSPKPPSSRASQSPGTPLYRPTRNTDG